MTFEGHFGDLLTVVTLCAQITRDLSAIVNFLATYISECLSAVTVALCLPNYNECKKEFPIGL